MQTILVNTKNSKANEPHRFRLSLEDRLNLKNLSKNIALVNLSIYYNWKNIKSAYNDNKFNISLPTWNDEFNLPDGSHLWQTSKTTLNLLSLAENRPIQIYPNKIKIRIVFKVKRGYKLELISSKMMKLLGGTKKDMIKIEMVKMYQI